MKKSEVKINHPRWIDSHAHIDKLDPLTPDILKSAREARVHRIITIGTDFNDWKNVIQLCSQYKPELYGALGLHPHKAIEFDKKHEKFLKENLKLNRIVAVGEIGLDYYYEHSERKIQNEVFEKQMDLAFRLKMPVEIHSRSAEQDTAFFLKKYQGKIKGLLHCFTSSYHLAKQALDYGFNISFSGILTFKNSPELREICKKIPLDRMHIETDSPFLSPEPRRGKENQPSHIRYTAHNW